MPLYNRLIEKVNEEEERPLGTADPLKIRPKVEAAGKWISDQYNKIPEESRTELERQLSIGLQPERWPDGTEKPNTFKILGEAYKPIQAVKDELSRATGLDPINFDAAEITADVLTPGIPLSKKALTGIVDIIDTSPFKVPNPFKVGEFAGGVGAGGWGPDEAAKIFKEQGQKIIKENLESDPVNKFLLGQTTKLPKQHRTLIQNAVLGEVTDADFKGTSFKVNQTVPEKAPYIPESAAYKDYISRLDDLIEKYPGLEKRLTGLKGSFLWNEHHINPKSAPIDFYVGRTNISDREFIRDLLINEFKIFSGNSPLNRISLPTGMQESDIHGYVHRWLAPRIGERSDVLKAKWAKEAGLNIGPLKHRTGAQGYLAGQQYLSDADRLTRNNYMSQLPVDGKLMKRYIREYGAIIKESEDVIKQLMEQFDAFYRVPKGAEVELTPDLLVKVLDGIDPTTPIKLPLIENIIRDVVQDDKLNLINPVTKEIVGVAQKSQKELDMLFRADDLMSMLDAANKPGWTGANKQIWAWAKELNNIYVELGIFPKGQLSLDLKKGAIGAYLNKARESRFGSKTGVLSDIDKGLTIPDAKIEDIVNELFTER